MQIKKIKPEDLTQDRNIYVGTLDESGGMVLLTFKEFMETFDDFQLFETGEEEAPAPVKKRGRPKKNV